MNLAAQLASLGAGALAALYALVLAMLVLMSIAGVWTFPSLLPRFDTGAWLTVGEGVRHVGFTAALAALASASALMLVVAWFEAAPARWDRRALPLVMLPIRRACAAARRRPVPGRAAAAPGRHGTRPVVGAHADMPALCLGRAGAVLAQLRPALRGHGAGARPRAAGLLWRVKWPMLRVPLAAAGGGRLRGQRGAVPADALHRRRPARDGDDRGGHARLGRAAQPRCGLRAAAGALPAFGFAAALRWPGGAEPRDPCPRTRDVGLTLHGRPLIERLDARSSRARC